MLSRPPGPSCRKTPRTSLNSPSVARPAQKPSLTMGLFDKKPKIFQGVQAARIRVEKVPIPQKPKPPKSSSNLLKPSSRATSRSSSAHPSPRPSPQPSSSSANAAAAAREAKYVDRKRKAASTPNKSRSSPAVSTSRVEFDSDSGSGDDDDWLGALNSRKRQKRGKLDDGRYVDPNRSLRHKKAFEHRIEGLRFIHAADVASLALKCTPVLGAKEDEVAVRLQYPSLQRRERYVLFFFFFLSRIMPCTS